jgi:hypothetical protein
MRFWAHRGLGAGDEIMTRRELVASAGGRTFLAPTLVRLAWSPEHPLLAAELPFPFAAVVGVDRARADLCAARSRYLYTRPAPAVTSTPPDGAR